MNRGSILIFTMIMVLILSILLMGLLSVGGTEVFTTQNFYLRKVAYYNALEGLEEIRRQIWQTPDPDSVAAIQRDMSMTTKTEDGIRKAYMTGTLEDYELSVSKPVTLFEGFNAPPIRGVSSNIQVMPVVWSVSITSRISFGSSGNKFGYVEILAGIYSIVPISH